MRLAHIWQRRLDEQMRSSVGLTAAQFRALAQIGQEPGIGSAALGRKLLIVPQSAGPLVSGLVRQGYIERDRTAVPGTLVGLSLTVLGKKALDRAHQVAEQVRLENETGITATEADTVNIILNRILTEALVE